MRPIVLLLTCFMLLAVIGCSQEVEKALMKEKVIEDDLSREQETKVIEEANKAIDETKKRVEITQQEKDRAIQTITKARKSADESNDTVQAAAELSQKAEEADKSIANNYSSNKEQLYQEAKPVEEVQGPNVSAPRAPIQSEITKQELLVCNGKHCHKGREIPCKTHFRVAFLFLTPEQGTVDDKLAKLEALKANFSDTLAYASRGVITFDLSYPVQVLRVTEQNKEDLIADFYQEQPLINNRLKIDGIANTFLQHNPDQFEFLIIITDWPYSWGYGAFISFSIRNNIMGMGYPYPQIGKNIKQIYSNILEQVTYSGNYENIFFEKDVSGNFSREYNFEKLVAGWGIGSAAHEMAHRWAAFIVGYDKQDSVRSLQRSGSGAYHWKTGLSTDYDLVGGGRWKDNGDGTFTLLPAEEQIDTVHGFNASKERFSLLTLYLAGALNASEVPPILFVEDYDGPLTPGITVPSNHTYVTIDSIIRANGVVKCLADYE